MTSDGSWTDVSLYWDIVDRGGGVLKYTYYFRGGPRFSDRLLRWSPDPTGGIWNATQETELPG